MKYFFLAFCFLSLNLSAQNFDLKSLEGDWQNIKDSSHHEIWELKGDSLSGWAMQIVNSEKHVWETLKIYPKEGKWVYSAKVNANESVISFDEVKATEKDILFLNEEHDFPNYIYYNFLNTNRLQVEVYSKGRTRVLKFEFERMPKG